MANERLQKIIAAAGVTSRRKAEELITSGHVSVNGKVISELGAKADPEIDSIHVDGKPLVHTQHHIYVLLNKPKGYVTTVSDPEGRPTVIDLVKGETTRLYPVGRLDYSSEGLLLLTNDGQLAHLLTQAASHVEKTYLVKVSGRPTEEQLDKLRSGVTIPRSALDDKRSGRVRTAPARIQTFKDTENPWYEITLIEGKNRQIRKMFEEIGHHVEKIKRVKYGPLELDVEPGQHRRLTEQEVEKLRKHGVNTKSRTQLWDKKSTLQSEAKAETPALPPKPRVVESFDGRKEEDRPVRDERSPRPPFKKRFESRDRPSSERRPSRSAASPRPFRERGADRPDRPRRESSADRPDRSRPDRSRSDRSRSDSSRPARPRREPWSPGRSPQSGSTPRVNPAPGTRESKPPAEERQDREGRPFRPRTSDRPFEKKTFGAKPFAKKPFGRPKEPFRKEGSEGARRTFGKAPFVKKRGESSERPPTRKPFDPAKKLFGDPDKKDRAFSSRSRDSRPARSFGAPPKRDDRPRSSDRRSPAGDRPGRPFARKPFERAAKAGDGETRRPRTEGGFDKKRSGPGSRPGGRSTFGGPDKAGRGKPRSGSTFQGKRERPKPDRPFRKNRDR